LVTYDTSTCGMDRTILVVENDIDLIQVYKEILESYEFDVQTALNGEEGVEKFKQTKPSLVIMDGDMPCLMGLRHSSKSKRLIKTPM